jgi:hypothetical protein
LGRVFEISPGGHVVVPALKELPPVKAYSETSRLDPDHPEGFLQLLKDVLLHRMDLFAETYGDGKRSQPATGPVLFSRQNWQEWERLLVNPEEFQMGLSRSTPLDEMGPLLTSAWHQQEPYNQACPVGDGGVCDVGCVATALAQVMRYHEWPPTGVGDHLYYWNGDQSCGGSTPPEYLSADFRDAYDWANMPTECSGGCTPDEETAMAELCFEVGVAFQTDYGACNSFASLQDAVTVLPSRFRYDDTLEEADRSDHTPETWFALIQLEINEGRPLPYGIQYSAGGRHVIVCDGWRDTGGTQQVHVNYGWGGAYTGWYTLDDIHHSTDPMEEYIIRGVVPRPTQVLTVNPDGTGTHATIQAAVNAAAAGDTIELAHGTFIGEGNRDIDVPDKGLVIRFRNGDPDSCVIDCQGAGRAFFLHSGRGAPSVLQGITIANGQAEKGGGVLVGLSSPTFIDCVFRDNSALESGGAMCWDHNSSPTVDRCTFWGNAATKGGGIWCMGASEALITRCTFSAESAIDGSALYCTEGSSPRIENSIVAFSLASEAVYCDATSSADLVCCDLYGNAGGDWVGCIEDQQGLAGNFSEDPLFCDPGTGDFQLAANSPCAPDRTPSGCGLVGVHGIGCIARQRIPLGAGWNCVSSYVVPDDPSMASVWSDPIAAGHLNIVRSDCEEEFCIPGMVCNSQWNPASGYMAHLSAPDTLIITGDLLPQEGPLALNAGWNCLPFLPRSPAAPEIVLGGCWDAINIIRDNCTGEFCIPGSYCGIDLLYPGKCYMVHMESACELYFPTPE